MENTNDLFHSFHYWMPYVWDKKVIEAAKDADTSFPWAVTHGNGGYVQYNHPGTINQYSGWYEIGGKMLSSNVLYVKHRFFRANDWDCLHARDTMRW